MTVTDARPPQRDLSRITIALLLLLMVITGCSIWYQVTTVTAQNDRAVCYQRAFDAFTAGFGQLTQAAAGDRQAQRELLGSTATTPAEKQVVFQRYLAVLDQDDTIRRANPLVPAACR